MSDVGKTLANTESQARFPALGSIFALLAAFSFAAVPTLVQVAYNGGADPLTVAAGRYLIGSCALLLMILMFRRPILLPRSAWPYTLLVTLSWFLTNVSFLAAIFYLPVGLAVLLLFSFPLLAAAAAPLFDGTPFGRSQMASFALGLVGLGLTLFKFQSTPDLQGVFFALVAACGACVTTLVSRRLVGLHDIFTITVYVNLGGALLVAGALALLGGFSFPYAFSGWGGLVGASAFYAVAIVIQFAASGLTGPARTGLLSNAEPLLAIVIAAVLLGEVLLPEQYLGAFILTTALILLARGAKGRNSDSPRPSPQQL